MLLFAHKGTCLICYLRIPFRRTVCSSSSIIGYLIFLRLITGSVILTDKIRGNILVNLSKQSIPLIMHA
jgi:hypothetical protein